jgi:hypothetical protein
VYFFILYIKNNFLSFNLLSLLSLKLNFLKIYYINLALLKKYFIYYLKLNNNVLYNYTYIITLYFFFLLISFI